MIENAICWLNVWEQAKRGEFNFQLPPCLSYIFRQTQYSRCEAFFFRLLCVVQSRIKANFIVLTWFSNVKWFSLCLLGRVCSLFCTHSHYSSSPAKEKKNIVFRRRFVVVDSEEPTEVGSCRSSWKHFEETELIFRMFFSVFPSEHRSLQNIKVLVRTQLKSQTRMMMSTMHIGNEWCWHIDSGRIHWWVFILNFSRALTHLHVPFSSPVFSQNNPRRAYYWTITAWGNHREKQFFLKQII